MRNSVGTARIHFCATARKVIMRTTALMNLTGNLNCDIMKKFKIFAALSAAAFILGACSKDIDPEQAGGLRVPCHFTAYLESSTKTALDANNGTIWKAGDKVAFYTSGTEGAQIKEVASDGRTAEFYVDASEYVNAVYGATVVNNGKRGLKLQDVVKATQDGSFGDAHVSVAHTVNLENPELHFRNITSMLRFKVKSQDVAFVRVYSRTKAQLGGDVQVMFDSKTGEPTASFTGENPIYSVKVVTQDKDGYFYVSLLPGTYKGGIEVRCFNGNGSRIASAASKNDFTIAKNKIVDMGELDEHFAPEPVDLSTILGESLTANCYIAPGLGEYKFPVVNMGASSTPVSYDEPFSVDVLWETYGNDTSITPGSVVSDISYGEDYVYITTVHDGSAIVAIRDQQGNILWTWHIWVWEGYDIMQAAQKYHNDAGYMMDRNLGAANATVGDPGSRGFLYQWGRKDPFLGASTLAVSAETVEEKHTLVPMSANTTVAYSVAHPMTFIYASDSGGDWLPQQNDELWGSERAMYDPCPPGWKVPDSDFWYKALGGRTGITKSFDRQKLGIEFAGENNGYALGEGPSIWYPATGYRDASASTSVVSWIQWYGFWWSSGVSGIYGSYFSMLGTENSIQTRVAAKRAGGFNVRCQLDFTPPEVEVQSITLDKQSLSLKRYGFEQLTATVSPSYATHPEVKWETSNAAVATVSSTGLVTGAGEGDCTITVSSVANPSVKATCSVHVDKDQENLLAPANCFIVDKPGQYRFDASIKGNGTAQTMEPVFARLLWSTYGDSNSITLPVVDNVTLDRERKTISFDVLSPMKNGNAVICAVGATGEILWSWHIWACAGFNPEATQQTYNIVTETFKYQLGNDGKPILDANGKPIPVLDDKGNPVVESRTKVDGPVFMDRNLGATSAVKGDAHSLGLLYQWGRKDPFVTMAGIASSQTAAVSGSNQTNVAGTPNSGNIDFSVKNPTVFISGASEKDYDWMYEKNDNLWDDNGVKTIYDPCPAGWRVPKGGEDGDFTRAFMPKKGEESYKVGISVNPHPWDTVNRGMDLSGEFGDGNIWYPFAAYRARTGGELGGHNGMYSRLWTRTAASSARTNSYAMFLNYGGSGNGDIVLNSTWSRSFAASVRCVKE